MLNAKTKKAFKGFKILTKIDDTDFVVYCLMDNYDHACTIELRKPADPKIVDFVESLGYWRKLEDTNQ